MSNVHRPYCPDCSFCTAGKLDTGCVAVEGAASVVTRDGIFLSCSQELCQQVSWLLIGYTRVNNQSEARTAS